MHRNIRSAEFLWEKQQQLALTSHKLIQDVSTCWIAPMTCFNTFWSSNLWLMAPVKVVITTRQAAYCLLSLSSDSVYCIEQCCTHYLLVNPILDFVIYGKPLCDC